MLVTVEYTAQVKRAAGIGSENFDVDNSCTLEQLLSHVVEKHGQPLESLLFDTQGALQKSILLFVGDDQVRGGETASPIHEGATVTILTPISGG